MNNDIYRFKAYLKVIEENTGYDFSGYSWESLNSRLENFVSSERIGSLNELKDFVCSKKISNEKILDKLLVSYTEMFRNPEFFNSLRKNVLPNLATFKNICIWHAGCATGEEVYSLAIILDEVNLLDRCEIYATDINEFNIQNATRGIYPLDKMKEATSRYYKSGGTKNLSNYYTAFYDNIIFHRDLRERIKFISHDMVLNRPVKTAHLVLCRNVFIYFNYELQQSVLKLLFHGLHNFGYLGMGLKEHFVDVSNFDLSVIDKENKIYRKVIKA